MNSQIVIKLVRHLNRTKFRKERSLIYEVCQSQGDNQNLAKLIEQNINLIKTYKGLLIIMDQKWLNIDRQSLVQKIQIEFDDRAQYGFNTSNELFIKFLVRVFEMNLWGEEFDSWLNQYVGRNAKKMHLGYAQQLEQTLQNYGLQSQYLQTLKDHIQSIEDAKSLI